jgi:hypothetical protein
MAANHMYAEEYVEEEATRTAEPRTPSYDDELEDRTRSARESALELEGLALARSGQRPARQAFVAPAELEGERSPAMRARKSFVDPSELVPTNASRPSFAAIPEASERRLSRPSHHPRVSQVEASERRASHVDRSERRSVRPSQVANSERRSVVPSVRPPPPPAPPTPRASRASYVASSERGADFASSVPSSRPLARPASAPSYSSDEVTSHRIASAEIEEVKPASAAKPADYEALKHLFDDVEHDSPAAAAMSKDDRSVSMRTPVQPMLPPPPRSSVAPAARMSHAAFAPASVAPAARASHLAFRPPMAAMMGQPLAQTEMHPVAQLPSMYTMPLAQNPARPSMPSAPGNKDSFIDSSWIVPTPRHATVQAPLQASPFKLTVSFIAAALTAIAALAVMVGAIVFIRSEDAPAMAAQQAMAVPAAVDAPAAPAPQATTPVVETPAALPNAKVEESKPVVLAPVPTVAPKAKKKAPKIAVAAPVAADASDDEVPAKPAKPAASAAPAKKTAKETANDKAMAQVLADLGEQQLKR